MVRVSGDFDIVIRKAAIQKYDITTEVLLKIMEAEKPHDGDTELIAFGPHFGGEAASEFARRLKEIGLNEYDDFFIYKDGYPHWAAVAFELSSDVRYK